MTADQVKKLLSLEPHPREGGWFRSTYEAAEKIPVAALGASRYPSPRRTGTAIFYLLEPETFNEMHRLRSDEIFHFYTGDPVELLQLHPDGTGSSSILGNDLFAGQHPQLVVNQDTWQGSRLVRGGAWALLGCTVSPGFEYEDYEAGERKALTAKWPDFATLIAALTHS